MHIESSSKDEGLKTHNTLEAAHGSILTPGASWEEGSMVPAAPSGIWVAQCLGTASHTPGVPESKTSFLGGLMGKLTHTPSTLHALRPEEYLSVVSELSESCLSRSWPRQKRKCRSGNCCKVFEMERRSGPSFVRE